MLHPVPPQFRRRRGGKPPAASAPPPPVTNQIVAVTRVEGDDFRMIVEVTSGVAYIGDASSALQCSADGEDWFTAGDASLADPLRPVLIFDIALTETIYWRVADPPTWSFVDGRPLGHPFTGDIS